jgi:hypothetical protein
MKKFPKSFFLLVLTPLVLCAQGLSQPSENFLVTAAFDPPVVAVGAKTFYRVTVGATESAIQWPDEISTPTELKFGTGTRGQITQTFGNNFRVLTSFVYEVQPAAPGHFAVADFTVNVAGEPVTVPAAGLDVTAAKSDLPPPRQLKLEISTTNLFIGQPFRVRVQLPAANGNEIEALREIQLTGGDLMIDKSAQRQSIEVVNAGGQLKPAFICEMKATPIATGARTFSAQGFTAGRDFSGPITIRGQVTIPSSPAKYVLLVSDPMKINVRPLPAEGELPGFTGALGKFFCDPPQLSTNRLHVGEVLHLKLNFHGEGEFTRFVPPVPPHTRDWQVIANNPPDTGFTFIPQTDNVNETPAIPFCYFDPDTGKYFDLTIPPLPVTVIGETLPVQVPTFDGEGKISAPQSLSGLSPTPGKLVSSLKPLQLQGWFVLLQLLPVVALIGLWRWDERRRFLAAHPDIVRRRKAKRDLRREQNILQNALAAGDAEKFVAHTAAAMRIAVAPHFPADASALVGSDVLTQLSEAERAGVPGETVRKIFAAADGRFALTPQTPADWLALNAQVKKVLQQLEEKL